MVTGFYISDYCWNDILCFVLWSFWSSRRNIILCHPRVWLDVLFKNSRTLVLSYYKNFLLWTIFPRNTHWQLWILIVVITYVFYNLCDTNLFIDRNCFFLLSTSTFARTHFEISIGYQTSFHGPVLIIVFKHDSYG